MSYSPQTGLTYIPANLAAFPFMAEEGLEAERHRLPARDRCRGDRDAGRPGVPPEEHRRHHRRARRVGPGGAEGGLARALQGTVERRHAGDRRQPGVPGHGDRAIQRLQRQGRQEAVVVPDPERGHRRADDLCDRRRAICRGSGRLGRGVGYRPGHPQLGQRAAAQHQPPAGVQARRNRQAAGGAEVP